MLMPYRGHESPYGALCLYLLALGEPACTKSEKRCGIPGQSIFSWFCNSLTAVIFSTRDQLEAEDFEQPPVLSTEKGLPHSLLYGLMTLTPLGMTIDLVPFVSSQ
jgi:hypothetical protein